MAIIPKLAMIPSGYKDGKLYSVLPSDGVGDFDVTRGSDATRINKNGLIETVTGNTPRLDYPLIDGVVSGCPSLLLEPGKTNQLQRSQELENAYWINNGVTITSNNTISPDGTLNADLLTGVSGGFGVVRFSTWTATNKVASCFAKKGSTSAFKITNGSLSYIGVAFNLENGTVTNEDSGFEGSIEDYGNGWYRCTAIDTLGRNGTFSLNVTSASESVYLWGAQLESDYKTSYIPTTTSVVTRFADTANNAGNASTFNDSEGVLMVDISALANESTFRGISLNDGSTSNMVLIYFTTTPNNILIYTTSSGIQSNLTHTVSDLTEFTKIAIRWSLNNVSLWINGVKVGEDLTAISPVGMNKIAFDSGTGVENMYSKVKQLQYYNTALTALELETLTSYTSFNAMALAKNYKIQ